MNRKLVGVILGLAVLVLVVIMVARRPGATDRASSESAVSPASASPSEGAGGTRGGAPAATASTAGPDAAPAGSTSAPDAATPVRGGPSADGSVAPRVATTPGPPQDDRAEADAPPTGPPMDGPPPGPPSLAAEMHHLMTQVAEGKGPPLDEHVQEMLASEEPLMRAVGAAMLSASGPLPGDVLDLLAGDADLQVPLMVLGWLEDTGHNEQSVALAGLLKDRGVTASDLSGLVSSGALDSVAARAALDLLRNELPADDLSVLLTETAIEIEQAHVVRKKALLLLRDTMPFEDYRNEVQLIADATRGIDPLWDESLQRELSSLRGPAEVLDRPPQLSSSAVEEKLAREYPAMLDDLVLAVEYVLEHDEGVVAAGSAETLQTYYDQFSKRPWSDEQQVSLARLGAMIADVRALEEATSHRASDDRPPF